MRIFVLGLTTWIKTEQLRTFWTNNVVFKEYFIKEYFIKEYFIEEYFIKEYILSRTFRTTTCFLEIFFQGSLGPKTQILKLFFKDLQDKQRKFSENIFSTNFKTKLWFFMNIHSRTIRTNK